MSPVVVYPPTTFYRLFGFFKVLIEIRFRAEQDHVLIITETDFIRFHTAVKRAKLGILIVGVCISLGRTGIALTANLFRLAIGFGENFLALAIGIGANLLGLLFTTRTEFLGDGLPLGRHTPVYVVTDVFRQLNEAIGDSGIKDEVDKGMRSLAQSAMGKLDMVSREEFDAQAELLERTRLRVEELEQLLASLDEQISTD